MANNTAPNYKQLFEDCLFHLRCVSGSRNSFTPEVRDRLQDLPAGTSFRSAEVEDMHQRAVKFLHKHDK
jgi:hypothetical protein